VNRDWGRWCQYHRHLWCDIVDIPAVRCVVIGRRSVNGRYSITVAGLVVLCGRCVISKGFCGARWLLRRSLVLNGGCFVSLVKYVVVAITVSVWFNYLWHVLTIFGVYNHGWPVSTVSSNFWSFFFFNFFFYK
jgi:hypothetical protein